jgi:predicted SAM-dependent methyltransferase
MQEKKTRSSHVQYGCGLAAPEKWVNFDSSPRLILERLSGIGLLADSLGTRLFPANIRFGDIVRGLPVLDGSADAVYASHVLEHLAREDVPVALANTFRILKPGGIFRLIVPDLAWRAELYLRERQAGDAAAADHFIARCHIGEARRPTGLMGRLRAWFGNSGHNWMYDREQMTYLLHQAGFVDIRPCLIGDSGDPMFDAVEHLGRFTDGGQAEVALQTRRPPDS